MGSIGGSNKPSSGGSMDCSAPDSSTAPGSPLFQDDILRYHRSLLETTELAQEGGEDLVAPLMTSCVFSSTTTCDENPMGAQFGLIAGVNGVRPDQNVYFPGDHRFFFNVSSPSSTFICGSQGSGKSHTLSCLLENCLLPSKAGRLPNPLTGVVFHYDTFISDTMSSPCEAAFLSSNSEAEVRVLCSPTNLSAMQDTYSRFNVHVSPLQIDQTHLNTKRMLDLMAVSGDNGPIPLYMHTVKRILREMRILQQETQSGFSYSEFKRKIMSSDLTPAQLAPLVQRLDTLESFMPESQARESKKGKRKKLSGSDWDPKARRLTIVDLSCPCISPETACSLFNVCLGIFLEQDTGIGRVVALDEAHKYMNSSTEAQEFTETLLSAVRLQRHLGVRTIISTQEPTVSMALLGLCSVTVVHRFTSPDWLRVLHKHLAGAVEHESETSDRESQSLFNQIVDLQTGEAIIFAPSAIVGASLDGGGRVTFKRLGKGRLHVRIRHRLTTDGGKSVLSL